MIINPYLVQPSIPPFTGLLDTYGGAGSAYSTARRLSTSYTGALIRVRRSSDNAEQDIGYDGSNVLDESALTTFVGANNGFVTKIYDQSGNSAFASQSTAANQPKIVSSGTIIKVNSKPAMEFDGVNDSLTFASNPFYTKNTYSFFDVGKFYATVLNFNMMLSQTDAEIEVRRGGGGGVVQFLMGGTGGAAPTGSAQINNIQKLFSFYRKSNVEAKAYVNNTQDGTTMTPNSSTIANTSLYLGSRAGSAYFYEGTMQEILIYNTDQSANHSNINGNINTFYSIY
jgi:hypothetical protein